MSPRRLAAPIAPAAQAALTRMAVEAGQLLQEERHRRRWSLRHVADRAGVSSSMIQSVESGSVAGLETYARVAVALGLRPDLTLVNERPRSVDPRRGTDDFVHAAMGEWEARALAKPGRHIGIDEPYQHYQFAGRADVLSWEGRDLLHVENRTQFPNLQDAAGAYNAKREYLARALAGRAGIGPEGWRSVTHVMACLWSAEVLHVLRLRRATFEALCPDNQGQFEAWLRGARPVPGTSSTLILLDPAAEPGSRRRAFVGRSETEKARARHRDYADAAQALRRTTSPA